MSLRSMIRNKRFGGGTATLKRSSPVTTGSKRTQGPELAVGDYNVLITPLSGRIANSILGRFPDATSQGFAESSMPVKVNDILARGDDRYVIIAVNAYGSLHKELIMKASI